MNIDDYITGRFDSRAPFNDSIENQDPHYCHTCGMRIEDTEHVTLWMGTVEYDLHQCDKCFCITEAHLAPSANMVRGKAYCEDGIVVNEYELNDPEEIYNEGLCIAL